MSRSPHRFHQQFSVTAVRVLLLACILSSPPSFRAPHTPPPRGPRRRQDPAFDRPRGGLVRAEPSPLASRALAHRSPPSSRAPRRCDAARVDVPVRRSSPRPGFPRSRALALGSRRRRPPPLLGAPFPPPRPRAMSFQKGLREIWDDLMSYRTLKVVKISDARLSYGKSLVPSWSTPPSP